MHLRSSHKLAFSALILLGACSTAEIQSVEMLAFTTSMEENLKIVDSRLEKMNLPDRIADDRRAQLVANSGYYELSEGCAIKPSALLTEFETLSLQYFDERCKMVGLDGKAAKVAFVLEGDLDRDVAAKSNSAVLKAYMAAISELSSSDGPTQVASKLAASLTALNKLAEGVVSFQGEAIKPDVSNTIKVGSTLAETLAREGLEAMRYRALAAIVRDADPAVYAACLQLALWLAHQERMKPLDDAFDALNDAEVAATDRAVTMFLNGVTDETELSDLISTEEDAYKAMAEFDRKANWHVFIGAAQAHRALRDAFARPFDLDAAAKAQVRIDTLVNQTIAFVKAVNS